MATNDNLTSTGIEGLDDILRGGLQRARLHLLRGPCGAGKTTLALQFLLAGAARGEPCLYVGSSETEAELRALAVGHGWNLDSIAFYRHQGDDVAGQTVLHTAEAELPHAINGILAAADRVRPARIAIDSLNPIQLLAQEESWYYHQLTRLKDRFARAGATVLLTESPTSVGAVASSLVCSVIELAAAATRYGADHRRLRIAKVRARPFAAGWHDYRILTGGLEVYPSLPTTPAAASPSTGLVPTGVPGFDGLLGGGLGRGGSTLLVGEPGSGKTFVALQFALAAAERREPVAICLFDEGVHTVLGHAARLGLPLGEAARAGLVRLHEIDGGAFTDGWFAHLIRKEIRNGAQHVVLDSLDGYRCALASPRARVRLRQLFTFLTRQTVTTVAIAGRHSLAAAPDRSLDLNSVAYTVIAFETCPWNEEIHPAVRVLKHRVGPHHRGVHRLIIDAGGARLDRAPAKYPAVIVPRPTPQHTGASHG